ncbi:50S ribosomal protein L4 [Plectosphaerella plurivora]|uniref:Large ribosomal subunit protein uL29m n=1 Tax=Plectosphaerella plurivora TaxID=936078 RepID=A0A9P8VFU4_9PEZI|nr:50S ribosomal protein L4 [Plectosphaerella plurivora]
MASSTSLRPAAGHLLRLVESRPRLISSAAPSFVVAAAPFSTSASQCARKTRDNNRKRGVSPLKRSGPREPLSVSWEELPKPTDYKPQIKTDPNHPLWAFFPEQGKLINTPAEDQAHGRAWGVNELRQKSWEDLHALWWVCCRERNRISTSNGERARTKLGFGEHESNERDQVVQTTMKAIKHVLTERYYAWEDAYQLAHEDPEINLSGKGPAYKPSKKSINSDYFV